MLFRSTPDDRTISVRHAGLAERHNRGEDIGGRLKRSLTKVCSYAARVRGDDDRRSRDIIADLTAVAHRRRSSAGDERSEEHTSELQSLMRISYAVFCLKKKNNMNTEIEAKKG